MYETGMRPSEVFALRTDHVDFDLGKINVLAGKTNAARRRLTMTGVVRDVLAPRCRATINGYLFGGGKKGQNKIEAVGEKPILKVTNAHLAAVEESGLR